MRRAARHRRADPVAPPARRDHPLVHRAGSGPGRDRAILAVDGHDARARRVRRRVFALRVVALPLLLRRALARAEADAGGQAPRETSPLVNVTASLLAAAVLTLLAFAVARPLVALAPGSPAAHAIPVGLAVALIGFFALVTRRRALSQLASVPADGQRHHRRRLAHHGRAPA